MIEVSTVPQIAVTPSNESVQREARRMSASRIRHREWVKEELVPYIRNGGGVVNYDNISVDLGVDPLFISNAIDFASKTLFRVQDLESNRYLALWDYKLPTSHHRVYVFDYDGPKNLRARNRRDRLAKIGA